MEVNGFHQLFDLPTFFKMQIVGRLNCNCKKPQRNQGRTLYNTSYRSFTMFGTLKLSYFVSRTLIWSYRAGLELYSVLPCLVFFFTVWHI